MKNVKFERATLLKGFSHRLIESRQRLGLTQSELADKVGVTLRAIQLWEAGKAMPQISKLRRLSQALGVPIQWLIQKEPQKGNATAPVEIKQMFPRRVPVVSWANAGKGGDFVDLAVQIDEYLDTDCRDPNAYALIIEGDSMMPEFKPGDRVIFMPNVEPKNGDVVVARLAKTGDVFFKLFHRVGRNGEIVRLTSFNPAYPPLEYHIKEFAFIHPMHSMVRLRRA